MDPHAYRLVRAEFEDPAEGSIERMIKDAAKGSVFRVEYPLQDMIFERSRQQLRELGQSTDTAYYYHGTPRIASRGIIKYGFDYKLFGAAHGQVHGPGVYLTPRIQTAIGYSRQDLSNAFNVLVCEVFKAGVKNATADIAVVHDVHHIRVLYVIHVIRE